VTVARSMRLRSTVKGIPLRVAVPADAARVAATLTAKGFGRISVVERNGVKAGSLRLRPSAPLYTRSAWGILVI
jgi:hypothetical protein